MKKLKQKIESLNLNYKNELTKLIGINALIIISGAVGYLFYGSYLILVLMLIALMVGNLLLFNRYAILSANKEEDKLIELMEILSYLRMYLNNDFDILLALDTVKELAKDELRNKISNLLKEIEDDKSITPFLTFSSSYKNKSVDEMMYLLYQMSKKDYNQNILNEYNYLLNETKEKQNKSNLKKRNKTFDYINLLTILGGAILIIILSLGVIGLIGEFNINGS